MLNPTSRAIHRAAVTLHLRGQSLHALAVGVDALGLGHLVHRRVSLLEGVAHEGALELLSLGGSGLLGGGAAPDGLARDRTWDARSVSAP